MIRFSLIENFYFALSKNPFSSNKIIYTLRLLQWPAKA